MSSKAAKSLRVATPGIVIEGTTMLVYVRGLTRNETVTISIDGAPLATARAPMFGAAKVVVPLGATPVGAKTVVATGSSADRIGRGQVTVGTNPGGTSANNLI